MTPFQPEKYQKTFGNASCFHLAFSAWNDVIHVSITAQRHSSNFVFVNYQFRYSLAHQLNFINAISSCGCRLCTNEVYFWFRWRDPLEIQLRHIKWNSVITKSIKISSKKYCSVHCKILILNSTTCVQYFMIAWISTFVICFWLQIRLTF